ncbi:MAG: hypothetical protein IAE94_14910 [Chthoniobacterales bacterium]|nr:hypothetical protein [Chthoniobacterales bacterium]
MTPKKLPFRQVHLDFHTSPDIPGIGAKFDKPRWQDTLREAEVNSITLFSKCHHGWSYHPTSVGRQHPHLAFDLLRAQYDACKEIGIAAPIYLSAGVDNLAGWDHPEWREINPEGAYSGWVTSPLKPGFQMMDFLSPYLDYLCAQIEEAVRLFPDCDGIFLDIISQSPGCSKWRMAWLEEHGWDAASPEDRQKAADAALEQYYIRTTQSAKCLSPDMPIFHNSGHIRRGDRGILKHFSHLELESLPTGGWGYDHFPMSAKYACNLGLDFLGMTGKFHTTWGEFGGQKHPNALRYECAAMLAFNSKCSIGDQLHPGGELDETTYRSIGAAYREVALKEPWCAEAVPVSDIGVLSQESESGSHRQSAPDEGAARALLEGHFLFEILDREMDFSRFKLLILPDTVRMDGPLKARLDGYLAQGGRLLLTGESGLWKERANFAFEIGADYFGPSEFSPDFILPEASCRADFLTTPVVMYVRSQRIRVTTGESLGRIYDPYFNRDFRHFCSHQHTPFREEPSGFDCGVRKGAVTYLAHPVFTLYRMYGAVAYREYISKVIAAALGTDGTLVTNLPSTARVALNRQKSSGRHILHLLFANTISRGGTMNLSGGTVSSSGLTLEVIEELLPLRNTRVALRGMPDVRRVTLEPGGRAIAFSKSDNGVEFTIEEFTCHQMVVLESAG